MAWPGGPPGGDRSRPGDARSFSTNGHRVVYLHPGQLFASAEACAVSTVLGSCVSICLYDAQRRVGGINHYLLPYPSSNMSASEARFSNVAFERLVDELARLGSVRPYLQAKIFGGASVLKGIRSPLGTGNVAAARALLAAASIPIVSEDVGGDRGRRLIFYTDDGTALVRRI